MSLRLALGLLPAALGAVLLSAFSGCSGGGEIKLCGEIPQDGCPIGRGGTCEDPVCAALYDCVDGRWTQAEKCPALGGDGGPGSDGGDAGLDAACMPVMLSHEGETTGCAPDLQEPDCPVVAAETCAHLACLSGCMDFFLCTANGWKDEAYCDEQGNLVVVKP